MLKLFIFDVDGCLTDGKKIYDKDANCCYKSFCDKDWTVLKRLQSLDIKIHAITGDPWNENILKARNINHSITRSEKKENLLPYLIDKYKVTTKNICYIGDDIFDRELLLKVKYSFCPNDAIDFRSKKILRLNSKGGENVLVEVFNFFKKEKLIKNLSYEKEMEKVIYLDRNEKF